MIEPRISVLVPCFNDGQWLDEAVDSVFAQTFQDFEIIIVDDGSTDSGTVQKLAGYSRPRTRVYRTENRGLPAARNYAAARAHGELFCALDADDRLAPTWFERAVEVLDTKPEIAFVSHWLETFGDQHWLWEPEKCDLAALLAHNTVNGAALVRRSAFEAVAGYEESMRDGCEDWDFWLRIVERGLQGTIIPEVLFYYRRRAESMSRTMADSRGYPRPFATLLQRHASYYRQHVVELLAEQEGESTRVRGEIARLERDLISVLEPDLARAREELDAANAKTQISERRTRLVEERDHSAAALATLTTDYDALRSRYEDLSARHQELSTRHEEVSASHEKLTSQHEDLSSRHQQLTAQQATLLAANDKAAAERERLTQELTASLEERARQLALTNRLSADIRILEGELVALRRSLSWRSTAILRRVYGWFLSNDR